MTEHKCWPPPEDWYQVVVPWSIMLANADYNPNKVIAWVNDHPGGRYHLHGWEDFKRFPRHGIGPGGVDGFAFRFENQADAMLFALRWGQHE